jgi:hypothetical protein
VLKCLPILLLIGCGTYEKETSWECGKVTETHYEPSKVRVKSHTDSEGQFSLVTHRTSPHYTVVFSCEHGQFVVEGSNFKYKSLWKRLQQEATVQIKYYKVYKVDEKKGSREFVGHEFIDAFTVPDCHRGEL